MHPNISKTVKNFVPVLDRVVFLQLNAQPVPFNTIQVYAPTCDALNDNIEQFYARIKTTLNLTKPFEVNVAMGDFNAKIGQGRNADVMGDFDLRTTNERNEKLIQFCQGERMIIANIYFQLPHDGSTRGFQIRTCEESDRLYHCEQEVQKLNKKR